MKTQAQLIKKFGNPTIDRTTFESKWMQIWEVPEEIRQAIPVLPRKIYINHLLIVPLEDTLRELIGNDVHTEIVSYDGVFNIRQKRGSKSISAHSWGIAIDLNAKLNPFRGKVTWTEKFLQIWRDNGWICGADWSPASKDGMHFQWEQF